MNNSQRSIKFTIPVGLVLLASRVATAQQVTSTAVETPNGKDASAELTAPQDSNSSAEPRNSPAASTEDSNTSATATSVASQATVAPNTRVADAPPPLPTRTAQTSVPQLQRPPTPLPNKIAIGKDGWLQVGLLLQGWYDLTWRAGRGEQQTTSTFLIRRSYMYLQGHIVPGVASFFAAFDPAATLKFNSSSYTMANGTVTSASANTSASQTITTYTPPSNTGILQDLSVTLKSPFIEASVGQFKVPISYEGQAPSNELIFPERAYSSRYFGDSYDIGVKMEKDLDFLKYQAFILNGQGQNQIDTNKQKDLAVRLEVTPVKGLMFGVAGLTSVGQRAQVTTTQDRIEFDARYKMNGLLIQGELIWGINGQTGTDATGKERERTKAAGRYIIVGYTIGGKVQPVIRYGYLNTDKTIMLGQSSSYALFAPFGLATDEVRSYEVGVNYLLRGNELKLQAMYGYFDFDNIQAIEEMTMAAQVSF